MKLIADQESAWAILLLMKYFMKKNPNAKKRDVAVKNRIQANVPLFLIKKNRKLLLCPIFLSLFFIQLIFYEHQSIIFTDALGSRE